MGRTKEILSTKKQCKHTNCAQHSS